MPNDPADGLTFCMLASGSRGNAIYLAAGDTRILIDAGLSGVEIQRRLQVHRLPCEKLDAILVTHEHSDHIQAVGVLARRFQIPVYIAEKTLKSATSLGKLPHTESITSGRPFKIGAISVHPFSISHDAADPVGYTFAHNGAKIGLATDLGFPTALVKSHLKGCTALIVEANHDPRMLTEGPYPWPLKQRIRSRSGHLSNEESCQLLSELAHPGLRHVTIAHLSETNNTPEIARATVAPALETQKTCCLHVAAQDHPGELIHII